MSSMYELTFNDNTIKGSVPEKGRCRFHITDINAGNLGATQTALADLLAAIQAIVIGELNKERIVLSDTFSSNAPAASPLAQRENKWLVTYVDSVTNKLYRGEIPTADLTLLTGNSESLDLSAGVGLTFKQKFEAIVKSPDNNAVDVVSVTFVGRSS